MQITRSLMLFMMLLSSPCFAGGKAKNISMFVENFFAAERIYYAIMPGIKKICFSKKYNKSDCLRVVSVINLEELKVDIKASLVKHLSDKDSELLRKFSELPLTKKNAKNELYHLVKEVGMPQVYTFDPLTFEEIEIVKRNEPDINAMNNYTEAFKPDSEFSITYRRKIKSRISKIVEDIDKQK